MAQHGQGQGQGQTKLSCKRVSPDVCGRRVRVPVCAFTVEPGLVVVTLS